jgi:hypothetical protein
MIAKRPKRSSVLIETLTTEQLLAVHERLFAPLDPVGRARMLATARVSGWDRDWDDRLAA